MAFFTAAMNTSPISAVVPEDERRTRITESSRAPVLSAQRTRVYGLITLLTLPLAPALRPRARARGSRRSLRPPRAASRHPRRAERPRRPRRRATVRLATGRAATAARAGALGAAARVAAGLAVVARARGFAAGFFSLFSATGLLRLRFVRALGHDRPQARDLSPRLWQGAEVLQLPRRELELRVEEVLVRGAQLVRDLVVRQPPHVLHPQPPPLSR